MLKKKLNVYSNRITKLLHRPKIKTFDIHTFEIQHY